MFWRYGDELKIDGKCDEIGINNLDFCTQVKEIRWKLIELRYLKVETYK